MRVRKSPNMIDKGEFIERFKRSEPPLKNLFKELKEQAVAHTGCREWGYTEQYFVMAEQDRVLCHLRLLRKPPAVQVIVRVDGAYEAIADNQAFAGLHPLEDYQDGNRPRARLLRFLVQEPGQLAEAVTLITRVFDSRASGSPA
mgnify:CR=1 FL=1